LSDKWEFYFTTVNDAVASIFVDVGIGDNVPHDGRPFLIWIWVEFQKPRRDGLSSNDEAETLFAIEDRLNTLVSDGTGGKLVGRITTAGRREFYYYGVSEAGLLPAMRSFQSAFPNYQCVSGVELDQKWSRYVDVLYPKPEDWQRIKNLHVIESLQKHGDTLEQARPVSHWAYFRTEFARIEFVRQACVEGFVVRNCQEGDNSDEFPFGVTLERVDRVDWPSINEATILLFRLAQDFEGDYDGWETSVETGG
jgi:hypothetical protein